ncbi:T9SS C-terminal target domain-containing protein [Sphingobacteriales bacterium UPWRP_1]|nr:hypothetical protein B6N25_13250 [Sphingobacteriales bacterium TSM_CSS]PSJ76922.1 T9SS C-terminal target domain-containing protein [Sphingobacteriales bacterium UPWRP_1]
MKYFLRFLPVAFLFAMIAFSSGQEVAAQSNTELLEKFQKLFSGNEQQQNTYYSKNKQKVSVTIKDLDWTDVLTYSSIKESLSTALAGSTNLDVKEINFTPDFDEGYYFLSFSLDDPESTKVVILDVAGREVHSETIDEFSGTYESRVNIPAAQKGTYFLKVIQGFSLLNKKLVIE